MRFTGATVDENAAINLHDLEKAFRDFDRVSQTLSRNYVRLGATMEALSERVGDLVLAGDVNGSQSLLQNPVKLQQIMQMLPVAIIIVDAAGMVMYANNMAGELFGPSLTGSLWRDTVASGVFQINDSGEMILPNGRIIMATTSPVGFEPGQLILFQDVTNTSNLRSMADNYNRHSLAYQINAAMAHQIRTPLTSALLYLAQLKSEVTTEKGLSYISRIHASLDHLDSLAINVLGTVNGSMSDSPGIAVEDVIGEITDMLTPLMVSSGCELTSVNHCQGVILGCDRELLKSIIINLIMNSVHACIEKDRQTSGGNDGSAITSLITITTEKFMTGIGKNAVRVNVEDNGIGIESGQIAEVVKPFYTTKPRGTGLGLSVTKSVIESMHGTIEINSQRFEGTSVALVIPVVDYRDADC